MKTRSLRSVLAILALGVSALLAGCNDKTEVANNAVAAPQQTFNWKLVTSWPKNFPGLGTAPERFADKVNAMAAGRLTVKVYGAGELVPALQVFDAVSQGTAEMGHSGAYYWKGKTPAAQFFTSVPFGMTAQEMHGWIRYGGGLELWEEVYAPFGILPLPGGNTGVQMGGWFNREINSVDDLAGLKMRIPGLGGEVLQRAGGTPVTLPGGEIFTSLQTGAIDATEWVGPYNDLAFGLYKVAKHYYYPGWHEPGSMMEFTINKAAFEQLPADLQTIVKVAAQATHEEMLSEYTARNKTALVELVQQHNVDVRAFPDDVMATMKSLSEDVLKEIANSDPQAQKVYDSYMDFLQKVREYHSVSEQAYINARD